MLYRLCTDNSNKIHHRDNTSRRFENHFRHEIIVSTYQRDGNLFYGRSEKHLQIADHREGRMITALLLHQKMPCESFF
ncbi:hypothetical protein DESC_690077 [Desulfosarcina cetonica]|nr:hypothetical protein DESC_690077 [Desulfosarcina cetonica]